jgi:hypothetical protein
LTVVKIALDNLGGFYECADMMGDDPVSALVTPSARLASGAG